MKQPRKVPSPPPREALRYGPLAVAIVAIVASIAGVMNGLTWDDVPIIQDSFRLHGLGQWREILTSAYWPPPALPDLYRPVTSLLLAAEHGAGFGAPMVFRLVSYVLYAAASLGVLRLASRLLSPSLALGIALLFAAHPVHVEAVAMAVGQGELIVCLLATLVAARYVRRRSEAPGHLGSKEWAVLTVLYLLASLAKEQGLLLPGLLLAAELLIVDPATPRARLAHLWKGFAALATAGLVVLLIRTAVLGGAVSAAVSAEALRGAGLGTRVLTLLQVIPEWLRLLVWPVHLRIEYRPQEFMASTGLGPREALGLALVFAAALAAWASRRRAPLVTFGIAWMAVSLFPVSNLVAPTFILIAERTLLLPSVGFLLAVGGALDFALRRFSSAKVSARILGVAVGLLVMAGVTRSAFRHRIWLNPYSLMSASVHDSPRSWHVWSSLGDLLFESPGTENAIIAYERAIELAPEAWRVRNDFAMRLRSVQRDSHAVVQLRLSLVDNPDQIIAMAELPAALIALGEYVEARHLADSIITTANAPAFMVWLRKVADSAIAAKAPAGSIRVGVGSRP